MNYDNSIQELAEEYLYNKTDENFKTLYYRLLPGLKKYIKDNCYYKLDYDVKEDLISNTFYKALNNIRQYDYTRGNFSTWLYRIARNELINEIRICKNKMNLDNIFSNSDNVFEIDIYQLDNIIDKESYLVKFDDIIENDESFQKRKDIVTLICTSIDNLSSSYKNIIVDREINNLSYLSLAKKYLLPIGTLKSRIKLGRKIVREEVISKLNKSISTTDDNYNPLFFEKIDKMLKKIISSTKTKIKSSGCLYLVSSYEKEINGYLQTYLDNNLITSYKTSINLIKDNCFDNIEIVINVNTETFQKTYSYIVDYEKKRKLHQ